MLNFDQVLKIEDKVYTTLDSLKDSQLKLIEFYVNSTYRCNQISSDFL